MRLCCWYIQADSSCSQLAWELAVQVKNLFVSLDTNNDGSIDTKELRKGLKAFGYRLADAEVEQLMNRMDLNQARCPHPDHLL